MKYHSKLQQIKRYSQRLRLIKLNELILAQPDLYKAMIKESLQEQEQEEERREQEEQQALVEEDEEMELEDDFDIAQYFQSMPLKLKQQFKQNNPQLPDIFFMNAKEKRRYFDSVNQKFKKKLEKAPRRKSSTKKKITFKPSFDVRGFNENQKVIAVNRGQQLHENYRLDLHYS